ncbi:hypothetical protein ACLJJ6_02725 [Pediococcus siamensis]|uniref:hypothetical protein n=1 Tax=Pediococcus siamensis TaxID=381829 RepID=UPI0039A1BF70
MDLFKSFENRAREKHHVLSREILAKIMVINYDEKKDLQSKEISQLVNLPVNEVDLILAGSTSVPLSKYEKINNKLKDQMLSDQGVSKRI